MRPRHAAQLRGRFQSYEAREFLDIALVEVARFGIGDVGEPFQLRRNVFEFLELGGS